MRLPVRQYVRVESQDRIVTQTPLASVWDEEGTDLRLAEGRHLDADAVRALLRGGPVPFVVADPGKPLRWSRDDVFDFWKGEVQPHFAAPGAGMSLEDFPGGYCYFAAEWSGEDGQVIVLTRHH